MIKKYFYIAALAGFSLSSCGDFGDINIDPESITPEIMDYKLVFTNVQQYCYGTEYEAWRNGLIYCSTMLQHTASTESYWNGDKYTYSAGYNSAYWDRMFPNAMRDVADVIENWKESERFYAEHQMARIMRVLLFQRMTDMYGDIPYSEAGMGYYAGNGYPAYDRQQEIYSDMLNELKEACENLNRSGVTSTIGGADLIYSGDVSKWSKFGYSLMLRLAMRLTKVDSATASQWTSTAVQGGLFTSNSDDALIKHIEPSTSNNSCEPFGKIYAHEDPEAFRMSESFVNLLRNTNDPRLATLCGVIKPEHRLSEKYDTYGGVGAWMASVDTTASIQIGMPNGYDMTTGESSATYLPNYPLYPGSKEKYSTVNRYTYGRIDAPSFLVTYAENLLLLAEAAYRGYISGSAQDYYESGVRAAMRQFDHFGQAGVSAILSEAAIEGYLRSNPFSEATALEQINTQYYILTFSDEYESFANWRRSGYPELRTVTYIGNVTNGTIPRRFTYPVDESVSNSANYREAVGRLEGGDNMTSRVWWDVR
ncbi:MAG: SusD/RagB family nutrient-binding outer membrane lipoprotein [Phocaeicola sp.]